MERNNICCFCGKPISTYYNCKVCNSCKTVSNFSLNSEELFYEVRKCIDSIQQYIESVKDMLHDVESRFINEKQFSFEEQRVRDFCESFQSIRSELEPMIADNRIHPKDKRFRMCLYRLLELSADFSNVFHHKCHILSI